MNLCYSLVIAVPARPGPSGSMAGAKWELLRMLMLFLFALSPEVWLERCSIAPTV